MLFHLHSILLCTRAKNKCGIVLICLYGIAYMVYITIDLPDRICFTKICWEETVENVPIDDTTKSDIHFASTGIYGNSWIIEDGINIGDGYNLLCFIGLISCLRSNLITEPKHPPQRLSTITSFVNIFHLLVVQVTFTCSDLQPSNSDHGSHMFRYSAWYSIVLNELFLYLDN